MSYLLVRSAAFVRSARQFARKHPQDAEGFAAALEQLAADPFHPSLKTHKLQGPLRGCWACSAGYDLRIVFRFVKVRNKDAVLLQSIGTHDEVY